MIITVDTLFKILNFALLLAVVVYCMRRYGISFILSSMAKEEQDKKELNQKHKKLLQEYDFLDKDMQSQSQFFEGMKKKFYLWEQIVQRKIEQYEVEQKKIQHEIEDMHNQQRKALKYQKFLKQEFPTMVKEVEKDLRNQFDEHPDKKKLYVTKLLSVLEK